MIARLKGILLEKEANRILMDVQGVGYEVHIPLSTYYELGEAGETVTLYTHTHVKEDILSLFGFLTRTEKQLFVQLIQISGIGPKLANTVLSGLSAEEFRSTVAAGNAGALSRIPGIGKKTAERIIVEMRDKIAAQFAHLGNGDEPVLAGGLQADVVSALVNLGYPRSIAEKAVSRAAREEAADRFEDLLKQALKRAT